MKHTAHEFNTVATKGGKQYVEVKTRLLYLAHHFDGEYSINTEYEYFEARKMWVVRATLTLQQGKAISTYTGIAQEIESEKFGTVNNTSALENAETSAVGRACAMAGIGIEAGIASADEVNKAISRGEQNQAQAAADLRQALAELKDSGAVFPVWNRYPQLQGNEVFVAAAATRKAELAIPA